MIYWLNSPTTELTTAATDALLGILCLVLIRMIRKYRQHHAWKVDLWRWLFGVLAAASFLGAIAHGFRLSSSVRNSLWQPLYLALGIDVALFVVGSVIDWLGEKRARRLLPPAIAAGTVFYSLTLISDGSFLAFVVYEGIAMAAALSIYIRLAVRQRLPGAATIALAIALNIAAAALQAGSFRFTLLWPFDHNGIFHLVQTAALLTLACGLRISLTSKP